MKKGFRYLLLFSSLLMLSGSGIEAATVYAVTASLPEQVSESSESKETEESTQTKESSTQESTPRVDESTQEELASEDAVLPEEREPEEKDLAGKADKKSSQPAVVMKKKTLTSKVDFKGTIEAGSENSETLLEALVIQRRTDDEEDWQDHRVFEVPEKTIVSEKAFPFDLSEELVKTGTYQYRVRLTYHVSSIEEAEEQHVETAIGLFELGAVSHEEQLPEDTEDTSSEKQSESSTEMTAETDASMTETDTSTTESTDTPRSESGESKESMEPSQSEESKEETEVGRELTEEELAKLNESLNANNQQAPKSEVPSIQNDPIIPKMEESKEKSYSLYGGGFGGIMPLAANVGTWTYGPWHNIYNTVGYFATPKLEVTSAKYTSYTTVQAEIRVESIYRNDLYMSTSAFKFRTAFPGSTSIWEYTGSYPDVLYPSATGTITLDEMSRTHYDTTIGGFPVAVNEVKLKLGNFPINQTVRLAWSYSNSSFSSGGGGSSTNSHERDVTFHAPTATDISHISTPTFIQETATPTTIFMNNGNYYGDTTDNPNDGVLCLTPDNGGTWQYQAIAHDISTNGNYYGGTIGGLTPGSQYISAMMIPNWLGEHRYSSTFNGGQHSTVFYTPNTVDQPWVTGLYTPTPTSAVAGIKGKYHVGNIAAHPSEVDVQISTDNATWEAPPSLTGVAIDGATEHVTYDLGGLKSKTKYFTRFRVKNASGIWSAWSLERDFTTNGSDINYISTPKFDQSTATPTSIFMENGEYYGDTTNNYADGVLCITPDNQATWQYQGLTHDITTNGKYYGGTIGGLTAGTEYTANMMIPNWLGEHRYSSTFNGKLSDVFYTPNVVDQPWVTGLYTASPTNAVAALKGKYHVGNIAAHPSEVDVQISTDNVTWGPPGSLTNVVIDTATNHVTYDLSGLNSKTRYFTRFRVKNASGIWSAWSEEREIITKSAPLIINTPTFDQSTATANGIEMDQGSYTGDISQTVTQGNLWLTGDEGVTPVFGTNSLGHTSTANGTYDSHVLATLTPGTRYRGRVDLKDYEENWTSSSNPSEWSDYFYTKNVANQPNVPTLGTPTNMANATAAFKGTYLAGNDSGDLMPDHPDDIEVQLSQDDASWTGVNSTSTPKLDSTNLTAGTTREAEFDIHNLKANETYYVRYRVKNNAGWSEWSVSRQFITLAPPPGTYLLDQPTFDFGMLQTQSYMQTAGLSAVSQKNHVVVENTDTAVGWTLSAKLEELKRISDSAPMSWATLSMDINLQNTTDGGATWNNYTTGVTGVPRSISLAANGPSQNLWSIANAADAQGKFRNEIDWSSVQLTVPENQHGLYKGKLVWSIDTIP